jgi:hypothetical protein
MTAANESQSIIESELLKSYVDRVLLEQAKAKGEEILAIAAQPRVFNIQVFGLAVLEDDIA